MKIYWTMNSIPELDGLDRKEKRKRYREIFKQGRKHIGCMPWVYVLVTAVVVSTIAVLFGSTGMATGAIVGGCMGFAAVVFIQSPAIEHGRIWYREQYGSE